MSAGATCATHRNSAAFVNPKTLAQSTNRNSPHEEQMTMRTIIAGSRGLTSYNTVLRAIDAIRPNWTPTVVISGTAQGADRLGERWAKEHDVPVEQFPADWNKHGKRAGYLRNEEMADHAEALLALWDGESRGTKHMIDIANRKGLLIYVYRID